MSSLSRLHIISLAADTLVTEQLRRVSFHTCPAALLPQAIELRQLRYDPEPSTPVGALQGVPSAARPVIEGFRTDLFRSAETRFYYVRAVKFEGKKTTTLWFRVRFADETDDAVASDVNTDMGPAGS